MFWFISTLLCKPESWTYSIFWPHCFSNHVANLHLVRVDCVFCLPVKKHRHIRIPAIHWWASFKGVVNNPPKITSAAPPNTAGDPHWSLLRRAPLLREDPENELSLLMGFKGRGDDDILSWRQTESLCYLPQVYVGLAFGFGGCVQEEVLLQMLIQPTHLWMERNQSITK